MVQRERTMSELNIISQQLSLLDDIKAKIEEKQNSTASGVHSEIAIYPKEDSLVSPQQQALRTGGRNGRDQKQKQLEDTFLGREISLYPHSNSRQESDVGNAPLLESASKTAELVASSTTSQGMPFTLPHNALYHTPRRQHDFSNNDVVQEESTESILAAAAAELNLSSEAPKNDVDEYHSTADAAHATAASHDMVGGGYYPDRLPIPLPSTRTHDLSRDLSREVEKGQDMDGRKPPADGDGKDDVV
jgi:hypothetical protein